MKVDLNIKFKFTEKTRMCDIKDAIATYPQIVDAALAQYQNYFEDFDFFSISILQFCKLLFENDIAVIFPRVADSKITFFEYLKIINTLKISLKKVEDFIKNTEIKLTSIENFCSSGQLQYSSEEAILITLKDFYNLHSLEEAQKLTLYEYLIARKYNYNKNIYEKNQQRYYKNQELAK